MHQGPPQPPHWALPSPTGTICFPACISLRHAKVLKRGSWGIHQAMRWKFRQTRELTGATGEEGHKYFGA